MVTTTVFSKNIKAYNEGHNLIVNQGGTRSGKTFAILQLFAIIAKESKKNRIISVVSYALPHLKLGAMRDFDQILLSIGIIPDKVKNKSENFYKINNTIIEFFGTDNLAKVHGPGRDILFVNEANFIKKDIYDHLAIRTRGQIFIDFNPSRPFWYHDDIQGKQEHTFIKSTYLDNEHLTAEQINRIEVKKANPHWWKVYGEGELGRLEGAIIENWRFGEFDTTLQHIYGLDFGVKDPDALTKVAVDRKNKKVYWKEEVYTNGMGTEELYSTITSRHVGNSLIVADSQSTRTIIDLKKKGLNIIPVVKPKIIERVKALSDYELIVDPNSYNMERELNSWVWLDKRGEVPIDEMNHLIDSGSYAFWYLHTNAGRTKAKFNF